MEQLEENEHNKTIIIVPHNDPTKRPQNNRKRALKKKTKKTKRI